MKKSILIIFCIVFSFIISLMCYAEKASKDLSNNIFRLHIIANSDNEYDQNIKLKVRDNVLEYLSKQQLAFNNIEETISYFNENINDLSNVVKNCLNENGYNLNYSINIDKSYFPTKQYDDISLPPGKYNCLKICLGDAVGKNWWCVLYPNLCSTDLSVSNASKKQLQDSLTTESYEIISNNVSYKFKIVEFIQNIKNNNF